MKSLRTGILLVIIMLLSTSCLLDEDELSAQNAAQDSLAGITQASPNPTDTPVVISATSTPEPTPTATPKPSTTPKPTATPQPTNTPKPTNTPEATTALQTASKPGAALDPDSAFLPQELSSTLYQITIKMDTAEVEQILGVPNSSDSIEYMYGGEVINYYYDYCQIEFKPRFVEQKDSAGAYNLVLTEFHNANKIIVTDPQYVGPRGIQIGDTAEQVFRKFNYPLGLLDGSTKVIYDDGGTLIDIAVEEGQVTGIGMLYDSGGQDFNIIFADGVVKSLELGYYLE